MDLRFNALKIKTIQMRLFCCLLYMLYGFGANAQVFMRPIDNAAAIGFGGASVAYPTLADGLPNEALLGQDARLGVNLGSAVPYGIPGWQAAHFQGFTKIGHLDGAGLDITHSGTEVYSEQQFRLLYGRRLSKGFFLGGSAAFMRVSAQEYGAANGITFGLGMLAEVLPGLWLGARIQNPFQQKVSDYNALSSMRIGLAWRRSDILVLLTEAEKTIDRKAQVKAGIEYRPVNVLVIRTGVRAGNAARIGFGAGVRLKNGLALDVGSEWHPSLGITPAAMLVWQKQKE